ncbi:MAG: penicillin-insensitive murein endopeptidase, partial [Polyangiaceae bacterium]|nr:penicillin-insensitive murein endopeptidase [Polyangiaceae bacterium]
MNAGAYLVVAPGLIAASLSLGCLGTPSPLTPETGGSVGLPYKGVLTAPVPLPARGKGYIRIKADGNHYGTSALVRTLQHASAEVDRQRPGPPLQIGDLSSIRGGKIIHHASHRSGRDVDLIFYATSLGGAMIPAQGFTRYGPDALGIAHQGVHGRVYLRLDIERNWLLAKALVLSPFADVMWLFVSNPIKALLTEYAFARGEDPLLVWQAENVMLQPRNALPHDDHFHLRIMCPGDSAVFGCEEGGPYWPWLSPAPALDWPH